MITADLIRMVRISVTDRNANLLSLGQLKAHGIGYEDLHIHMGLRKDSDKTLIARTRL